MKQLPDYDVIIVGARVAGSLLAALLGQKKHRVLLLDRARFPSDTLSTHFFRAPALRAFHAAGVLDKILPLAPHLRVNYNVVDGVVFPEPVDRPEDFQFYMCVRRITLDEILVQHAKSFPSVEVHEGAVVDSLIRDGGKVTGVGWSEAGVKNNAAAKTVVGADGVRSFVAKNVEIQYEHQEPVHRAMYYGYYRGIEPKEGPAAEFHYRGNYLAYCQPCDGGLTLLASSVPIAEFASFKRDPEGRLMEEMKAMVEIAPRLARAERLGPVQGSGSIPGYLRVPYGAGWALVGDAGMVMDPWSGQGMDQGSTHAVMLAGNLDEFLRGEKDWPSAMQGYHRERNDFSMKAYKRTCTFSSDLRPMTRAALQTRGLLR